MERVVGIEYEIYIEDDECGRNWYKRENLDDQEEIFLLNDKNRV